MKKPVARCMNPDSNQLTEQATNIMKSAILPVRASVHVTTAVTGMRYHISE